MKCNPSVVTVESRFESLKVVFCMVTVLWNRVCLLAGHLAGHMEDSRTPAFSTNPVLCSQALASDEGVTTGYTVLRQSAFYAAVHMEQSNFAHSCFMSA